MNFFRTVFSDDPVPLIPEPEVPETPLQNEKHEDIDPDFSSDEQDPNPNPLGVWSFGGLIKTISTKSESVLETYRRDLKEFGSGLKKEIEVAQGSLESVGHVIDEFGNSVLKGTADIISHGKEAILAIDHESNSSDNNSNSNVSQQSFNPKRYSRFDAQVRAIQCDINTYCEVPEDLADYDNWRSGFILKEKDDEIESLLGDNGNIDILYKRVVPNSIDYETFWCRYFYKVHKLKQAEDMMAKFVKRAISAEEEDLSWDVDDSESDDGKGEAKGSKVEGKGSKSGSKIDVVEDSEVNMKGTSGNLKDEESKVLTSGTVVETEKESVDTAKTGINDGQTKVSSRGGSEQTVNDKIDEEPLLQNAVTVDNAKGESNIEVNTAGKGCVESSTVSVSNEKVNFEKRSGMDEEDSVSKPDEKVIEGKACLAESCKDSSDFSVVSSQPSLHEEEDLGWDEIEDMSSIDESKVTRDGSPSRAELQKRLSTAVDEEEDLSWDIEDDDEPVKG